MLSLSSSSFCISLNNFEATQPKEGIVYSLKPTDVLLIFFFLLKVVIIVLILLSASTTGIVNNIKSLIIFC